MWFTGKSIFADLKVGGGGGRDLAKKRAMYFIYIQIISYHQAEFSYPAFFELVWLTLAPIIHNIYIKHIHDANIYEKQQMNHLPSIFFQSFFFFTVSPLPRKCFLFLFSIRTSLNFKVASQLILKGKATFTGKILFFTRSLVVSLLSAEEELLIPYTIFIGISLYS